MILKVLFKLKLQLQSKFSSVLSGRIFSIYKLKQNPPPPPQTLQCKLWGWATGRGLWASICLFHVSRKMCSCREHSGYAAVETRNELKLTIQSEEYVREDLSVWWSKLDPITSWNLCPHVEDAALKLSHPNFVICFAGKSRPIISLFPLPLRTCWCQCWWCRLEPLSWFRTTGSMERCSAWSEHPSMSCSPQRQSCTCAVSRWTGMNRRA